MEEVKKKRPGKDRFLLFYLVVVVIFGVLGLLDNLLSMFGVTLVGYGVVMGILAFLFFFFNLFALVHLMHEKMEKLTWVLPIYHLISFIIFFGIGIVLSIWGLFFKGVIVGFAITGLVTSSVEILFSLYLMGRYKFF